DAGPQPEGVHGPARRVGRAGYGLARGQLGLGVLELREGVLQAGQRRGGQAALGDAEGGGHGGASRLDQVRLGQVRPTMPVELMRVLSASSMAVRKRAAAS